jgi:flagellar biosynthesis/type III secretory pathway protein FliH
MFGSAEGGASSGGKLAFPEGGHEGGHEEGHEEGHKEGHEEGHEGGPEGGASRTQGRRTKPCRSAARTVVRKQHARLVRRNTL